MSGELREAECLDLLGSCKDYSGAFHDDTGIGLEVEVSLHVEDSSTEVKIFY